MLLVARSTAMHDSFTPLGGLVPLVNIQLGEIIFGGVGAGLYGMIMFVILTVFIAGLMVGRTPEYVGKKIEGREVKYRHLGAHRHGLSHAGFSAWGVLDPAGLGGACQLPVHTDSPRSSTHSARVPATTEALLRG